MVEIPLSNERLAVSQAVGRLPGYSTPDSWQAGYCTKVAGNITIHSTDSRYGPATHQVSPRAAKPHAGSSTPFCPLK